MLKRYICVSKQNHYKKDYHETYLPPLHGAAGTFVCIVFSHRQWRRGLCHLSHGNPGRDYIPCRRQQLIHSRHRRRLGCNRNLRQGISLGKDGYQGQDHSHHTRNDGYHSADGRDTHTEQSCTYREDYHQARRRQRWWRR